MLDSLTGTDTDPVVEERKNQREHDLRMAGLQNGHNPRGQQDERRAFLKEIIDTSELDTQTIDALDNMLARAWMLANMQDAEVHEVKYFNRIIEIALLAVHPPEKSVIQGEDRKRWFGDQDQGLESLSDLERLKIRQVIQIANSLPTRSRDGWLVELFGKSWSVVESREDEREEKTSGLLGGLRS